MLVRLFLGDRRQQEDRALEGGRAAIARRDVGVVVGPVGRRGDRLFIRELQSRDAAHNLIHVAPDARWVVEREHQLVLGVDDEDGADGKGQVLVARGAWVDHAVRGRDRAVGVADDRKLDLDVVLAVCHHVVQPLLVRLDRVNRERRDFAIHRRQIIVLDREAADLGGAYGREIGGVRE